MKITFLVGNGFDISAGIDTSYKSFYKWYFDQPSGNKSIKIFKNSIAQNAEYWSDLEEGLGKYTEHFTKETVNDFVICHKDVLKKIIEYIKSQYNGLSLTITEDYLVKFGVELEKFYKELTPVEFALFDQMFKDDMNNSSEISFITFNYTNIIDQIISSASDKALKKWMSNGASKALTVNKKVIHLHGTLGEFPLLGVNDSKQVLNQELLEAPYFSETLFKSKGIVALGRLWHEEAEKRINESHIICIWGSSIGLTDMKWWNLIVHRMLINQNCHVIIYEYKCKPFDILYARDYISEVDGVKNKLLKYASLKEEQIQMLKPRIHVIINTKSVLRLPKGMIQIKRPVTSIISD